MELGAVSPVLEELLRLRQFSIEPPGPVRGPGCGHGHDVVRLAQAGYFTTGLDFAAEPLQALATALKTQHELADLLQADLFALPDALRGHFAAI